MRLPVIPEQCRLHHPWGPGLVALSWEPCDCPTAQNARGGHITIRCMAAFGTGQCQEVWTSPRHFRLNPGPLGHHRPGYR